MVEINTGNIGFVKIYVYIVYNLVTNDCKNLFIIESMRGDRKVYPLLSERCHGNAIPSAQCQLVFNDLLVSCLLNRVAFHRSLLNL